MHGMIANILDVWDHTSICHVLANLLPCIMHSTVDQACATPISLACENHIEFQLGISIGTQHQNPVESPIEFILEVSN